MKMPLDEQLKHIKEEYPEGYDYLSSEFKLPRFDDNDEVVSWGVTPQDSPHDVNKKEDD